MTRHGDDHIRERMLRAGRAVLAAEHAEARVREALRARPSEARFLIAVGKAAAAMAAGVSVGRGLVVDKAHQALGPGLRLLVAGHPLPDERSVAATRAVLAELASLDEHEELLLLLSGGASALLGAPIDGISLDELRALTRAAMKAGLPIEDLNCLRRRACAALGGRLGAGTRASIRALIISDVASDDPRIIGSGPVSPPPADDPSRADELARALGLDDALRARLRDAPTPSPRDRVQAEVLASPSSFAVSAAQALAAEGFLVERSPTLSSGPVEGLMALLHTRAAELAPGAAFVIVGEPTVRVRGDHPGGRAQHLALGCVQWLSALGDRALLALASDGSDGTTDAAGAIVDALAARAALASGEVEAALDACDSHRVLASIGALIHTGPTGTNLTDLYVVARPA